ncbi:hypothetical protein F5Y04DRAFT_259938 [Hypomontagnella monticulosa]|nr:hypothetical protein F5Y04DRAFT_259938 [Hypomontagnella monticulosa]
MASCNMEPSPLPLAPLRRACARCHAQKLRCPGRSDGEGNCARCIKAGVLCIFGTSVRGKRPATVAAQGLRTAQDMDDDFLTVKRTHRDKDIPLTLQGQTSGHVPKPSEHSSPSYPSMTLNWSATLDAGVGVSVNAELVDEELAPLYTPASISSPSIIEPTILSNAHIQVVASLTTLNLDLLRHANTVPPLTGPAPDMTKDFEPFKLDDTFQLTTAFLNIVRSLHLEGNTDVEMPSDNVVVDVATVLLAMSCWRRLADIYDHLFIHVRRCAEQTVLPATKEGKPFSLPFVSIGSFVPDAAMSLLLQMVATLHHSSQLANDMSDFAARMSLRGLPNPADESSIDTDLHCRAANIRQKIRSIRAVLMQTGCL